MLTTEGIISAALRDEVVGHVYSACDQILSLGGFRHPRCPAYLFRPSSHFLRRDSVDKFFVCTSMLEKLPNGETVGWEVWQVQVTTEAILLDRAGWCNEEGVQGIVIVTHQRTSPAGRDWERRRVTLSLADPDSLQQFDKTIRRLLQIWPR